MLNKTKCLFILLFVAGYLPKIAQAEPNALIFMYNDHEPYVVSTTSGLSGFLVDYIKQVAADADFTPLWKNVVWEKQLPALQRNAPNICTVTLYKTIEREAYIRFTVPIGTNGGFVRLSTPGNTRLTQHRTFKDVIQDPNLTPVLQIKTIYNNYIDSLLSGRKEPKIDASVDRIARSRLSDSRNYFIVADVRARALLKKDGMGEKIAVYRHYADIADDTPYYVGCSMATNAAVFDRLNQAIKRIGPVVPE